MTRLRFARLRRRARRSRLRQLFDAWSWADRGRRLVNVPISQAMELWLARHAPSGGAR